MAFHLDASDILRSRLKTNPSRRSTQRLFHLKADDESKSWVMLVPQKSGYNCFNECFHEFVLPPGKYTTCYLRSSHPKWPVSILQEVPRSPKWAKRSDINLPPGRNFGCKTVKKKVGEDFLIGEVFPRIMFHINPEKKKHKKNTHTLYNPPNFWRSVSPNHLNCWFFEAC